MGGWARNNLRCERLYCRSIVSPKRTNWTDSSVDGLNSILANVPLAKTLLSLRPSPPRASVRGPCAQVSPYSSPPALLHQRRLPRLLRSHAETSVAAGGLGEECKLGRKLHFSFYAKAVPPPVSGSCEPYFCPNSVSC